MRRPKKKNFSEGKMVIIFFFLKCERGQQTWSMHTEPPSSYPYAYEITKMPLSCPIVRGFSPTTHDDSQR